MRPIVEISGIGKRFGGPTGSAVAIEDVSFQVRPGEIVCIAGKTGCGKSTLVNMLLGLERPTSGRITVEGISPTDDFMDLRRRVAAVFQTDRMLPWRTVVDNAALGLEAAGVARAIRRKAVLPWLERVGLANWGSHYPHQLSGGMRQRVAIARAFVLDPVLIILDEAFGHLDEVTAQQLRQDCLGLISATQKAAIVVTHNISEALDIGSRLLVLGRPARVLADLDLVEHRKHVDWSSRQGKLRADIFQLIEEQSGS